jgi:methanogenic corrinoid protein MtbC1
METHSEEDLLSIGAVAEATALSVDTIRVWERRYGRPEPIRLPSGHRRYTPEDVRWLRRVAEALARGHRPAAVVPLSEKRLSELVEKDAAAGAGLAGDTVVGRLLRLARDLDGDGLAGALESEAARSDPLDLVAHRIAPFLEAIGRAWADGEIDIRHEHLASEVVMDVLRRLRSSLEEKPDGPLVVLATLAGERHGAALQMVALAATIAGCRVGLLGTDTPNDEIVLAVKEARARAVAVSVSLATGGVHTDRVLADLRRRLPGRIDLLVGGSGARGVRRGPRGVRYLASLDEIADWAREVS